MAQPLDLTGMLAWRCIGPHRGGRAVAVAGDPTDPMTFYFGAAWVQRWESLADAELRWLAIYFADVDTRGQALAQVEQAAPFVERGRHWLPATLRSERSATTLVAMLGAAELWAGRAIVDDVAAG